MEAKSETINHLPTTRSSLIGTSNNTNGEEVMCPSCDAKLKPYEIADHCEQEIQYLRQIKSNSAANGVNETDVNSEDRRKPWTVFQKVQRNRQSRLKRTRRRQAPVTEYPCPICNENFSQDEIHVHTEQCLRRNNATEDDSSNEENDDTDEIETYEWAGQKRVRVSSLLRGGYASLGIGQTIISNGRQEEDDEDLNVDEDDTHIYGPPQFGERDVIMPEICDGGDSEVTNYVRRLITEPELQAIDVAHSSANITKTESTVLPESTKELPTSTIPTVAHYRQIIESLTSKLRQYEKNVPSKFKCLICLDEYRNPAISVSCWHVHCEECWLRSLGARKLCPQCNLITTPKDLRRIYM